MEGAAATVKREYALEQILYQKLCSLPWRPYEVRGACPEDNDLHAQDVHDSLKAISEASLL